MAVENLLMAAVRAGGDRQALHERIRVHAMAAAERFFEELRVTKWVGS
jgi:adenylosuccinate lyase